MVYCTIEEAWNQADVPEMKYYKEMPMPPITPANMYGYNQIDVVPRDRPLPHHRELSSEPVSTDMDIRPISRPVTQRIRGGDDSSVAMSGSTLNEYKKLVEELKKENAELKRALKEKEMQSASDGMLDVLLYISSGVFLLFFLEHVTSSARRF